MVTRVESFRMNELARKFFGRVFILKMRLQILLLAHDPRFSFPYSGSIQKQRAIIVAFGNSLLGGINDRNYRSKES